MTTADDYSRTGLTFSSVARKRYTASWWIPFVLVFLAITFNFLLCFLNTNVSQISRLHVEASEVVIILTALLVSLRAADVYSFVGIAIFFLYVFVLTLIRAQASLDGAVDVKIIHDFMIPVSFFLLGLLYSDLQRADRIVISMTVLVTIMGFIEYFFMDTFLKYLDITRYYIARGTVESNKTSLWAAASYVVRPSGFGRTLLRFLGDQRISSLFLEPASAGNFGVIVWSWALIRSAFEKKIYVGLFVMAGFIIIMADSRFGAVLCSLAIGFMLVPTALQRTIIVCAPFIAVSGLLGTAYIRQDSVVDNTFFGRLLSSGQVFASFDTLNWLGLRQADVSTLDSGFAYAINGAGILGFAAFWFSFMMLRSANPQFYAFRALAALYFVIILCVSASPFTIKTAALLWFLLGALAAARKQPPWHHT